MCLGSTLTYLTERTADHSNNARELGTVFEGFHLAGSGELVCEKLKLYGMRLQDEACMPHLFIMSFLLSFFSPKITLRVISVYFKTDSIQVLYFPVDCKI